MSRIQEMLDRLPESRSSGNEWTARCPAHDDDVASLSIGQGDDGRVLLHCHAGCSVEQICQALGLKLSDLYEHRDEQQSSTVSTSTEPAEPRETSRFRRRTSSRRQRTTFRSAADAIAVLAKSGRMEPAGCWAYHEEDGKEVFRVVRFESSQGKSFRPISRTVDGWVIGDPPGKLPLFRLPELLNPDPETWEGLVVVCEGEKAADGAQSLGLVATTSAHGAKSPQKTDWSPLAGRNVVILPDNDEAGTQYAKEVSALLEQLEPRAAVSIVDLPDLPEHGDIVDFITAQGDADKARRLVLRLAAEEQPMLSTPRQPHSPPFEPFPVDVLPHPVSDLVRTAAGAIGCDTAFITLPLLSVFAAAIGTTRQIRLKPGWCEPAILWTLLIGDSGTFKTPACSMAMKPLLDHEWNANKKFERAMAEYRKQELIAEQKLKDWKKSGAQGEPPEAEEMPVHERIVVSDITVESLAAILSRNPRGVLATRDELSGWVGSFDRYAKSGGGDLASWLSMHNAQALIVDRKSGFPPLLMVPNASVSVTGGIQPGLLARSFNSQCRESGLMARLLMAWPPRKAKRWTDKCIPRELEERLAAIVHRLLSLEPFRRADQSESPVDLGLTSAAHKDWVSFYNTHADEEVELEGELASAWSKLEAAAARLALVIHLVRWATDDPSLEDSEHVDAESVSAGVTLANWFGNEARRVYAMLVETEEQKVDRRLVEWIERKGGRVTVRQLQQGWREFSTSEQARSGLQRLVEQGFGRWSHQPSSSRGGRPTEAFELSPACRIYETPSKPRMSRSSVDVDSVDIIKNSQPHAHVTGA